MSSDSPIFRMVCTAPSSGGASSFSAFVAGLAAGQYAVYTSLPTGKFSGWTGDHFSWMTKMCWDDTRRVLHMMGKNQAGSGNDTRYTTFDEANNVLTDVSYMNASVGWAGAANLGHINDGYDVDRTTGGVVFAPYARKQAYRYDGTANYTGAGNQVVYGGTYHPKWPALGTRIQSTDYASTSGPLAYHPNLYGVGSPGIVFGFDNGIAVYNPATDTFASTSGGYGYSGGYLGTAMYHNASDSVWLTARGTTASLYKVSGASLVSAAPALPTGAYCGCGDSTYMGRLLETPAGRLAVFEGYYGNRIWTLNPFDVTPTWTLSSYTQPFYSGYTTPENRWLICYMPRYSGWAVLRTTGLGSSASNPTLGFWKAPSGL